METKPLSQARVVPLFRPGPAMENEPEVAIGRARVPAEAVTEPRTALAPDLTGRPKVVFLIGPGGSGKTMFARWMADRMTEGGREAVLAALDPQNRSLATWFEDVAMPESSDGGQTSRWLRELLRFLVVHQRAGVLDLGGGDTSLVRTIETVPDLVTTLREGGVEPVAIYMLTPRQDDLGLVETLESAGFQPRATLLVFNAGRVDTTLSNTEAFARVRRHSILRAAIARGAVALVMPRLEPEVTQEIEGKRLGFAMARDGQVPEGASFGPMGAFERAMVRRWLERMEQEFAPAASWLP